MLRKTMPFQIQEVKADAGALEFSGYASTFGNVDHHNDLIEQGAFAKTLQEWEASGKKRVKVLWQHDTWQPMGLPIEMYEDTKGLFVRSRVSDTAENRDRMAYMRDGVVDKMSIGFELIKSIRDEQSGLRRIQEIKLWEFSPVTFPANDMASIDDVKRMIKSMRNTDVSSAELVSLLEEIKSLFVKSEPLKSTQTEEEPTDKTDDPLLIAEQSEEVKSLVKQLISLTQ